MTSEIEKLRDEIATMLTRNETNVEEMKRDGIYYTNQYPKGFHEGYDLALKHIIDLINHYYK